ESRRLADLRVRLVFAEHAVRPVADHALEVDAHAIRTLRDFGIEPGDDGFLVDMPGHHLDIGIVDAVLDVVKDTQQLLAIDDALIFAKSQRNAEQHAQQKYQERSAHTLSFRKNAMDQ